jgi:hypothetical protein
MSAHLKRTCESDRKVLVDHLEQYTLTVELGRLNNPLRTYDNCGRSFLILVDKFAQPRAHSSLLGIEAKFSSPLLLIRT